MIRTQSFPCSLPKDTADQLNRESGRIYTSVMVEHYRVFRHTGHWLSPHAGEKLNDFLSPTILHAHSRDAAQQGFYKGCKTAKTNRGLEGSRYPHWRKRFRTTIWKNTGIRKQGTVLLLALARGHAPIRVSLPSPMMDLPGDAFLEMRLVWDRAGRRYHWHAVIEDGLTPAPPPGNHTAAIDLGEVHPAAATDGEEGVVFSARELRSISQYTHKRLAEINSQLSKKARHSRRYQRIVARKTRFLAQQKRKRRDIEHKLSRCVVNWAIERSVGTLAIGDVRNVAKGVKKGKRTNQKISSWPHGKIKTYIEYKALTAGIETLLVNEAYTSQTCPNCGHRHKPKGRQYRCPACGFDCHRDMAGAINILSRQVYGEVGRLLPPETKYRYPFLTGKRRRLDTAHVARLKREAATLEGAQSVTTMNVLTWRSFS